MQNRRSKLEDNGDQVKYIKLGINPLKLYIME